MTLTEWIQGHQPEGFKPIPYYSEIGDFLSCYFSDDLCYAERINEFLTIYRSEATKEIVGCKIKGVSILVEAGKQGLILNSTDLRE